MHLRWFLRVERTSGTNRSYYGNGLFIEPTLQEDGYKLHIAISSRFMVSFYSLTGGMSFIGVLRKQGYQLLVRPTESMMRKYFSRFGTIIDVQVNYYACNEVRNNDLLIIKL